MKAVWCRRALGMGLGALLLGLAPVAADEVDLPALVPIPDSFQGPQRASFIAWRANLEGELARLKQAGADFTAETAEAQTDAQYNQVQELTTAYIRDANGFNRSLASAVAAAALQAPAVVDLARDPQLAAESQIRLDQIKDEIGRIKKAINILGDTNPEWRREWEDLHEEQISETHELMWNSLDLATAGLAQGYEAWSDARLEQAQKVFQGEDYQSLMQLRDTFTKMRQTFGNSPALDKWINALNLLDTAVQNHETAHAIGFFREAIVSGKEAYEEAKKAGANSNAMDQLYHGSTAVGGLAVALVRGPAAEVVAPVAASLKIIEAGLRVKLVMEENRQFDALSDQAFQRDQEKLQLMKKQESLENQARDLQMVIQRSGGQQ